MDHLVVPSRVTVRRLLRRIALAVLGVQAATAGGLIAVDSWRKRMRPCEATFPRTEPAELPLGNSLTTVYSYGTVLYEDMLEAIARARASACSSNPSSSRTTRSGSASRPL
jgi:cardiolipin synthase A/B